MKSDFFGGLAPRTDKTSMYPLRRKELIELIKSSSFAKATEDRGKENGIVVLFAAFEQGNERFRQDKTFYIPNCFEKRAQWMTLPQALINRDAKELGFDAIELLGDECVGYELNPY